MSFGHEWARNVGSAAVAVDKRKVTIETKKRILEDPTLGILICNNFS